LRGREIFKISKMNKLLVGVFVGLFIGVIIGIMVIKFAVGGACPQDVCLSDSVIEISDEDYYIHVHNSLQNAKRSIHVVMFEIRYYPTYPESHANQFLQDLVAAKKRGVDVRVIMEGGESYLGSEFTEKHESVREYLEKGGVEVEFDQGNKTTHAKLIIIDGKVVILGSTNWSYHGIDENHETNVLITSKELAEEFEEYFNKLWKE